MVATVVTMMTTDRAKASRLRFSELYNLSRSIMISSPSKNTAA